MGAKPRLERAATVEDLRDLCRRRLPRPIFDFVDGGAFRERTLAANIHDFSPIRFRQHVLRDVSQRRTDTELIGCSTAFPVAIAPTGMSGMISGDGLGELHGARAARRSGVPFTLAMLSMSTLEEVADAAGPPWFQVALLKDRKIIEGLVSRARGVGCPVLMLTVTWPLPSGMNRRIRSQTTGSLQRKLATFGHYATKPGWSLKALRRADFSLRNLAPHLSVRANGPAVVNLLEPAATWDDVAWLRELWPGKLVIKGITNADEVHQAQALGVDAVSVSNHGGNQLDDAQSTICALPEVINAAKGGLQVLLDGGVRSGQDVLKALALGASGCLLGRAWLYGLGAAGEAGVKRALEIVQAEFDISLGLVGRSSPHEVDADIIYVPKGTWRDLAGKQSS